MNANDGEIAKLELLRWLNVKLLVSVVLWRIARDPRFKRCST